MTSTHLTGGDHLALACLSVEASLVRSTPTLPALQVQQATKLASGAEQDQGQPSTSLVLVAPSYTIKSIGDQEVGVHRSCLPAGKRYLQRQHNHSHGQWPDVGGLSSCQPHKEKKDSLGYSVMVTGIFHVCIHTNFSKLHYQAGITRLTSPHV